MKDPTYVKTQIDANPDWALAFRLSEWNNDDAPIGWGRYIQIAQKIRAIYTDAQIAAADLGDMFRAALQQ